MRGGRTRFTRQKSLVRTQPRPLSVGRLRVSRGVPRLKGWLRGGETDESTSYEAVPSALIVYLEPDVPVVPRAALERTG
jgi:hypothetical protein